jgi:hypothetical protein
MANVIGRVNRQTRKCEFKLERGQEYRTLEQILEDENLCPECEHPIAEDSNKCWTCESWGGGREIG